MKINALLSLSGVCRFHLIALEPEIRLYLSPLDLSPTDEAALAYPVSFARRMVEAGGLLKTRGAPSEWAGLAAGRLPEAAFLSDLEATWKERTAAAKTALERDWGLFCCAFSDPADTQRMFWRFLEPEQRAGEAQLSAAQRDAILRAYRRIDDWIGGLLRTHADPDTVVLVLSAHGYTGFRKAVDLNRWLVDVGYMRLSADSTSRPTQLHGYLQRQAGMGQASGIDWSQTDAYALGAGSVYLNLKGREPAGTVPPGAQAELLRSRLAGELAALRDPEAGDPVVARVVLGARLETATAEGRGPDLLVEFRPGYRMAWPSMLGGVGDAWLSPNRDRWSGDFAGMEPHRLPGVFFCNRKTEAQPQSIDVAPTVLSLLGLPIPDTMEGRPLLSVNRAAEP
ncbi:alkaline phosphatase family protein [bacterium]|nr:alkaline phosphatase family protein [bacterium]